jgi:chromosome segregation ATPase
MIDSAHASIAALKAEISAMTETYERACAELSEMDERREETERECSELRCELEACERALAEADTRMHALDEEKYRIASLADEAGAALAEREEIIRYVGEEVERSDIKKK